MTGRPAKPPGPEPASIAWTRADTAAAGGDGGRWAARVADGERERDARRRRRLLWAGILAVAGLALLAVGLTVANGAVAWLEAAVAIVLLVASFAVQRLARKETLYRRDGST
ncbi:DUF3040 domain-containing protein [Micromonospora sp. NBC_01655]|uniref:DUF3040 domain-containing protein n=1 Tax=Micromonospora sp. NBC_01655 TaxID=2975983 RepID=UPI00225BB4D2|nr:DUF3040 domain-containing protein [Micromonospora sp. NBC_01655]MCX4472406.1 DUF3040 domain-containing protein [Micromonospora sp. NBC_01655]